MSKKFIVKNDDTQKHYSFLYDNLVELPNGDMQTIIDFGVDANTEIDLEKPYDKLGYPNVGENGLFIQKTGKQKSFNVNPMAKPFNPIYNWYETQMTSDNTPSPLVASASSFYSVSYSLPPWKAFDGNNTTDSATASASTWATAENAYINSWIKLDFGVDKDVNIVQLTPRATTWLTQTPKEFYIESSINDVDWIEIGRFNISNWQSLTPQTLLLNKTKARYFRITHLSNNGANYAAWNEIKYGYKREVK